MSVSLSIHICVQPSSVLSISRTSHHSNTNSLPITEWPSILPSPEPLVTRVLLSVSMSVTTLGASYSGITQYRPFGVWLTSLRIQSQLSSTLQHGSEVHSFLRLNNIPLCVYATSSLSIHLSMNIWVASVSWLFLGHWGACMFSN